MEALKLNTDKLASPLPEDRPVGYLEVLNRGGKVIQRIPVRSRRRIHVGRAYDNDLIIDDPFICPHHLTLQWTDEKILVADRQSLNGVNVDGCAVSDAPFNLECGEQLRIGRTTLRFRSAQFSVAPTRIDGKSLALLRWLERPLVQVTSFLLLAGLFLLNNYLGTTREYEILKALPEVVGLLVIVCLWAMLWSFASRVMLHRWNFWCHCSVAFAGLFVQFLCEWGIAYFTFAFGLDEINTLLNYGISFLLIGVILYMNLHFASLALPKQLLKGAFGVSAVIVGLMAMFHLSQQGDFDYEPSYDVTFKAPAFKLVGSQSSDEFFAEAKTLLDKVDAEVAESDD